MKVSAFTTLHSILQFGMGVLSPEALSYVHHGVTFSYATTSFITPGLAIREFSA